MEAQVALPGLLARFPRVALAGPLKRRDSLTLRGYLKMPASVR